jgi:hypothetical protein
MTPAAIRTAKNVSAVNPRRFRSPATYLYSTESGSLLRTTADIVRALAADGLATAAVAAAGLPEAAGIGAAAGGWSPYMRGVLRLGGRRVFFLAMLKTLPD